MATAQPWTQSPAHLAPCETTRLDAGKPTARWALVDGVYKDERDRRGRDYVWTSRDWRARLLLTSTGRRTLRLTGRSGQARLTLRASWNGFDLGERPVDQGPSSVTWEVPAAAIRTGLNELRFRASTAQERRRQLSFQLESLDLEPAGTDCGPVETATAGAAFTLAPGAILLAQPRLPPGAELGFELAGSPGGVVDLDLSRNGRPQRHVRLTVGEDRTHRLTVGDLLSNELVFIAHGPGATTVRLLEISGDERPRAWRAACGLWWKDALAAAGLIALLGTAVAIGRRWPGSTGALWLDCGLLLVLALAVRFLYLATYPELDPGRFGDSYEYLQRSRYLATGAASLWNDTSWHAWQSWIRPPGYYLFLAALVDPVTGELTLLAKVQAVLLALTAVAGYLVAWPIFGRGAALVTGLLITVYPQTITSASWILSDPLALFLTTAALACLSWLTVRPGWPLALATGTAFGIGCLVRSAPLYFVPIAALLVYLGQRVPRRKAPALILVATAALVVLPWCARNSVLYGKPMGIDDLVIPNFLMAHPDPEILPAELAEVGVWGEADETRKEYFRKLWRANWGAHMTRDSGRILGRGLLRMAASPGTTIRRFGLHLKIYFQDFPPFYAAHFLAEPDGCRVSAWTDFLNLVYALSLVLALPGALFALRRRTGWPLVAWILFFVLVTNLFFYPSYMPGRYRLPIYPAVAALAGLFLARTGDHAGDRLSRRRRRAPAA